MSESTKLVDITGTMAKPNPDWQKRTEELAKPEYWIVDLEPALTMWESLTGVERERMEPKIKMVEQCAKYMLAGMVKGTVKYSSDDWTLEQWMAHLIGEGADQMNYQLLLFNKFHQDKEAFDQAVAKSKAAWGKP